MLLLPTLTLLFMPAFFMGDVTSGVVNVVVHTHNQACGESHMH